MQRTQTEHWTSAQLPIMSELGLRRCGQERENSRQLLKALEEVVDEGREADAVYQRRLVDRMSREEWRLRLQYEGTPQRRESLESVPAQVSQLCIYSMFLDSAWKNVAREQLARCSLRSTAFLQGAAPCAAEVCEVLVVDHATREAHQVGISLLVVVSFVLGRRTRPC